MKEFIYAFMIAILIVLFLFISIRKVIPENNPKMQTIKTKTILKPEMQITIKDSANIDTIYIYRVIPDKKKIVILF